MKTVFLEGDRERQKAGSQIAAKEADAVATSLREAVEVHLACI